MNCFHIAAAVTVFVIINFVNGQSIIDPYTNTGIYKNDSEGSYNITNGTCSVTPVTDMVFQEHIEKSFLPFLQRNATSTWYGDAKIYCLKVINDKDEETGGTAFVKEGGVGHYFVTVEMHSQTGEGMEFDVEVYAFAYLQND